MGRKSWAILCPAGIRTDSRNTEIVAEITDPIEYMTAAENRANGNLIAAAPDLYTELAKCVKLLDAISRPATRTEVAAESPALWARCIQVSAEARATLAKARPPSA